MICPNCSAENEQFHLFCHHCGSTLPVQNEGFVQHFPPEEDSFEASVEETEIPEPETALMDPVPAVPKGRHWPAVLIMAILTALGLLLFFLDSTPDAPSLSPVQNCFEINNGVLDFNEMYYTGGESLTIPETVDGQTVTALADYCFIDCDSLTEIILPDTLESIGDFAFTDCDNLRGIFITDNVTAIGEYAFTNCTALEAISIPASVTQMGEGVFLECGKLRHLFYSGTAEQWLELYSEYINGEVTVYASDISFSHDG